MEYEIIQNLMMNIWDVMSIWQMMTICDNEYMAIDGSRWQTVSILVSPFQSSYPFSSANSPLWGNPLMPPISYSFPSPSFHLSPFLPCLLSILLAPSHSFLPLFLPFPSHPHTLQLTSSLPSLPLSPIPPSGMVCSTEWPIPKFN